MRSLLLALFFIMSVQFTVHAQKFVPGFEDIPIIQGLHPIPEKGLFFDAPAGRLVESYLYGTISRKSILGFYNTTLPSLGWKLTGPQTFIRGDETLTINVSGKDGFLTVFFRLLPLNRKNKLR